MKINDADEKPGPPTTDHGPEDHAWVMVSGFWFQLDAGSGCKAKALFVAGMEAMSKGRNSFCN